jgi:alkylmercury lyase
LSSEKVEKEVAMTERCCGPAVTPGEVPAGFGSLNAEAGALRQAGFQAIRRHRRLSAAELAGTAGLNIDATEQMLDRLAQAGLVRRDERRRVVGIAGLSLEPTAHRLRLDSIELFTWCAFDAIGIPAALGIDGDILTRCWQCGASIELQLPAGHPSVGSPRRLWLPPPARSNVFEQFCNLANLFCDSTHLRQWRTGQADPPGRAVDLVEAASLGRDNWAAFATLRPSH